MADFQLNEGPLDEHSKKVAATELRETEENVKKGIEKLRQLLEEDKTLYYRTDDDFLMIFLRPCKFYPESAHALMKRVADFKQKNSSLLDNLMPEDEKTSFLENNVVNVLKNRDHERRRVLVVNAGKSWDPSRVSADQMFRIFYLIHEAAILEPETQVHVVKEPFLFNMVWQMFKPFVREKLKKRMFFHGSKMSSLHKHMKPSHLPKNYGGELPEIDYTGADWYPTIVKYEDHIRKMNSYGYKKEE